MNDPGTRATAKGIIAVERRLRQIYNKAKAELERTIRDFNLRFARRDAEILKKVADKVITQKEYQKWLSGTVFRGQQWDAKVNHCTDILAESNAQALKVINGEQLNVFAENATYQAYALEKGAGIDLGFGIYDSHAVGNLLKSQPELLPRRVLNGAKDKAWNKNKIANVIAQSIIKGDDIKGIAKNLSATLAVQNAEAMTRYARTAMTSAQNSGRQEMLEQASDEGINVKKKWIATLDSRTRDTHQELDGQVVGVNDEFEVDGMTIAYPGDPSADPSLVYNCRCTLGYVVDGSEAKGQRRAYEEWVDDDGKSHRKSYLIEDMSYSEWKEWKEKHGK